VFKQGNKRPKNFNQLNGDLVVTAKSSHAETLSELKHQYPELLWHETSNADPDELLEQVVNEQIAYTVADSTNLAVNRRLYPNLSVGFTVAKEQQVGWMITQQNDDSLYGLMIEFFGHMHQSGQLTDLTDKYFGHVQKFNYVDTKLFIKATETKLPQYEAMFKQYAQELDWRLLAALSYQESLWNPRAKSPTGVRGIMMLTLPTAKQMGVKSRLNAEENIRGGSKYLNRLLKRVPERIKMPDRLWFAIASYNIGWGHVEDARVLTQRFGGEPDKWIDVRKRLPLLRQRKYYKQTKYGYARGNEPVKYVDNIRRYYHSLVWLDDKRMADAKEEEMRLLFENAIEDQPITPVESPSPVTPEQNTSNDETKKNTQK
jgi:membrane-bound lytic murein transglycosylase F